MLAKECRFNYLPVYKEKVLKKLVDSDNLTKLVNYTDTNCLDLPSLENPQDLLYNKIFPYRFIPTTEDTVGSYIMMGFGNIEPTQGLAFKDVVLTLYIMCHKNNIRTDYGGRDDLILNEIDYLFNNERGLGIGKAEYLKANDELWNTNYSGYWISYKLTNFN